MKKILALVLAVVMVFGLAACGSSDKSLENVQKAGKLVIATSPDFPPFEELQSDGSVVGIEIVICEAICEKLGVELEIAQMDFDSVLPGIQAGKYDMGVSGITATEERAKNVDFTSPYCLAAQAIVVTSDSSIASKADLEGKTVAVQTGTTAESFCMDAGYDVKSYQANSDAELALTTGKVDAWVIDDLTAADMVKTYNASNASAPLVILSEAMTTEPYAFAFKKGSASLVKAVNDVIVEMQKDGSIAAAFDQFDAPYTAAN